MNKIIKKVKKKVKTIHQTFKYDVVLHTITRERHLGMVCQLYSGLPVQNLYMATVVLTVKYTIVNTTELYHIPSLVCSFLVQVPFLVF